MTGLLIGLAIGIGILWLFDDLDLCVLALFDVLTEDDDRP